MTNSITPCTFLSRAIARLTLVTALLAFSLNVAQAKECPDTYEVCGEQKLLCCPV